MKAKVTGYILTATWNLGQIRDVPRFRYALLSLPNVQSIITDPAVPTSLEIHFMHCDRSPSALEDMVMETISCHSEEPQTENYSTAEGNTDQPPPERTNGERLTIWKAFLNKKELTILKLPRGAKFLSVSVRFDDPVIWVLIDPSAPRIPYAIHTVGEYGDASRVANLQCIGQYRLGSGLVFHVFI